MKSVSSDLTEVYESDLNKPTIKIFQQVKDPDDWKTNWFIVPRYRNERYELHIPSNTIKSSFELDAQ